jgi:hypothetical protein
LGSMSEGQFSTVTPTAIKEARRGSRMMGGLSH